MTGAVHTRRLAEDLLCSLGCMAATSVLSSAAALGKQCVKVGLTQPWIDALSSAGVDTLGKLSYAVSLPGSPPSQAKIDVFAGKLRAGVSLSIGDDAALKRLVFEAQTLTVAELRASVQSGDDGPKKLPVAERTLRIEDQRKRLLGLSLEGPLAVAHALYDRFASMREAEELKYVAPNECITRDAELCGDKPGKALHLDANKSGIVVRDEETSDQIALDSDLQLYQAMIRRALAMDLVGLASFGTMQNWIERLFRVLSVDPPPGFAKVSRAQVLRADRQSFVELAREHNGAIKAKADGSLPLDAGFQSLDRNTEVMYFLLPTPGKAKGKGKGKERPKKRKHENDDSHGKRQKLTRDPIPEALKGMHSRTPKNKAICFNFNLGKCAKGAKCKFAHVCCKPGCYKPHPMIEHDSSMESE